MAESDISVSLKEYFDAKFKALEEQLALRDKLTDKALVKAAESLNVRLESMNEFRAELTKQAQTFVKEIECKMQVDKLNTKIELLTKMMYMGIGILLVIQIVWKYLQ